MPAVTTAPYSKLVRVGFSPLVAELLRDATPDWKVALRGSGLTPRQHRTLTSAGGLTMRKLLRGGFNRHQAKLILANQPA